MEKDPTAEKTELQQLIDPIDRTGSGWYTLLHWRDVIQRKFLRHGMTDTPIELDSDEFNMYLDEAAGYTYVQFENPDSITETEIKKILIGLLSEDWDKKAEIIQANIQLGSQAIKSAKDSLAETN